MMKGQSAGNRISVFQLNLNAMAPESISESYNYIETYRLEELADACAQLHHWCNYRSILYEMRNLKEIYRVAEHVFQHFISMAKMVTAFTNLCETDQLSLLKYSVTEILILRSVSCFLPNEDAWIFNLDVCFSQIYEMYIDLLIYWFIHINHNYRIMKKVHYYNSTLAKHNYRIQNLAMI